MGGGWRECARDTDLRLDLLVEHTHTHTHTHTFLSLLYMFMYKSERESEAMSHMDESCHV